MRARTGTAWRFPTSLCWSWRHSRVRAGSTSASVLNPSYGRLKLGLSFCRERQGMLPSDGLWGDVPQGSSGSRYCRYCIGRRVGFGDCGPPAASVESCSDDLVRTKARGSWPLAPRLVGASTELHSPRKSGFRSTLRDEVQNGRGAISVRPVDAARGPERDGAGPSGSRWRAWGDRYHRLVLSAAFKILSSIRVP